jgi:hypothetical protein
VALHDLFFGVDWKPTGKGDYSPPDKMKKDASDPLGLLSKKEEPGQAAEGKKGQQDAGGENADAAPSQTSELPSKPKPSWGSVAQRATQPEKLTDMAAVVEAATGGGKKWFMRKFAKKKEQQTVEVDPNAPVMAPACTPPLTPPPHQDPPGDRFVVPPRPPQQRDGDHQDQAGEAPSEVCHMHRPPSSLCEPFSFLSLSLSLSLSFSVRSLSTGCSRHRSLVGSPAGAARRAASGRRHATCHQGAGEEVVRRAGVKARVVQGGVAGQDGDHGRRGGGAQRGCQRREEVVPASEKENRRHPHHCYCQ